MQNTAGPCIIQRIENFLQQNVKKLKTIRRKIWKITQLLLNNRYFISAGNLSKKKLGGTLLVD